MADLAKTQSPITARRRTTDNSDFTLPARRSVDPGNVEVNAPIAGPNQSKAQALAQLLGVASDFGDAVSGQLVAGEQRRNQQDAAAGALAGQAGQADPKKLKSRSYADAYYTAGAQRSAIEVGERLRTKINERLADDEDPATPEDINALINAEFASVALDEKGQPRDLGSPRAGAALAQALAELRADLVPRALEVITKKQNAKHIDNVAFVAATKGLPLLGGAAEAPIQEIQVPASTAAEAENPGLVAPRPISTTGRMPVRGTATSGFTAHRARGSVGLDLAAPRGTQVEAPAEGVVIATGRDARSGNFVQVRHPDGTVTSYAHLDSIAVTKGQDLSAGAPIGAVGETGNASGPHLHYRVKVPKDGKLVDVDPATFKFTGTTQGQPAENPNLKPVVDAAPPSYTPKYDFEALMSQIPDTVPRGEAKAGLIDGLKVYAKQFGKPEILRGIMFSTRKDGSPSFTPSEIRDLQDAADVIETNRRNEARRVRNERWEANADKILTEIINDRPVSKSTLQQWVANGDLDPSFANSVIESQEAEARQAAAEVRAEERQARYEADVEYDRELSGLIAQRQAGDLTGASVEEDQRRLQRGDFGPPGKSSLARFRQARAAAAAGAKFALESPEAAQWGARLGEKFKVTERGNGSLLARGTGATAEQRDVALSVFRRAIQNGKSAAEAYTEAVAAGDRLAAKPGQDREAALRAREAELQKNR